MSLINMTVGYFIKDEQMLLGQKKDRSSKKIGAGVGLFNGPGGHFKKNENGIICMKREFKEETGGMIVNSLKQVGTLEITYKDIPFKAKLHLFYISDANGDPLKTDEMIPKWFDLDKLPYDRMWPNDAYILPLILSEKLIEGYFYYNNPDERIILSHRIDEVDKI